MNNRFDKETVDILLAEIGKGMPIRLACAKARISPRTYYNWVARGEGGEEPYVGFVDELEAVRADTASRMLDIIAGAARGDHGQPNWTAAMTWLERVFPEDFGRNRNVTVTHLTHGSLKGTLVDVDVTEELDKRLTQGQAEYEDGSDTDE